WRVCVFSGFFFQAEDGIRDWSVTGVQTCALPISGEHLDRVRRRARGRTRFRPAEQSVRLLDDGQVAQARKPGRTWGPRPAGHPISDERRVGKEGGSRGGPEQENTKKDAGGTVRTE